jgi:hypothetical protein
MKTKHWLGALVGCVIACAALAESTGPSLAVTLQVIQSALNTQGKLEWTTHYRDTADGTTWAHSFVVETGQVVADPVAGRITYHYKITRDGAQITDTQRAIILHDVQNIILLTGDQRQRDNDIKAKHPTWDAKVVPPIFDLIVQSADNSESYFFFLDEGTADRVNKAMGHAVELCGGSRGSF